MSQDIPKITARQYDALVAQLEDGSAWSIRGSNAGGALQRMVKAMDEKGLFAQIAQPPHKSGRVWHLRGMSVLGLKAMRGRYPDKDKIDAEIAACEVRDRDIAVREEHQRGVDRAALERARVERRATRLVEWRRILGAHGINMAATMADDEILSLGLEIVDAEMQV